LEDTIPLRKNSKKTKGTRGVGERGGGGALFKTKKRWEKGTSPLGKEEIKPLQKEAENREKGFVTQRWGEIKSKKGDSKKKKKKKKRMPKGEKWGLKGEKGLQV